jgi:hypothetical protein
VGDAAGGRHAARVGRQEGVGFVGEQQQPPARLAVQPRTDVLDDVVGRGVLKHLRREHTALLELDHQLAPDSGGGLGLADAAALQVQVDGVLAVARVERRLHSAQQRRLAELPSAVDEQTAVGVDDLGHLPRPADEHLGRNQARNERRVRVQRRPRQRDALGRAPRPRRGRGNPAEHRAVNHKRLNLAAHRLTGQAPPRGQVHRVQVQHDVRAPRVLVAQHVEHRTASALLDDQRHRVVRRGGAQH